MEIAITFFTSIEQTIEKIFDFFTSDPGKEGHLPSWLVNEYTFYILLVGTFVGLCAGIWSLIKMYFKCRNKMELNRDLDYSSFSKYDVDKATRFYVPTKFQNVSPSEDEEPSGKYIASAKDELIPLFLKRIFSLKDGTHKYFLIMADSGMGKTTFMINLYLAYKNKKERIWSLPKRDILLYSLGDPRTLERIKTIENKHDIILLLDAFDEDTEAIKDYKKRMSQLLEVVNEFRDVVITCRTQFFPSEVEEPHTTGYITFGDSNSRRDFQKLYLSVFSDEDIKKYLHKRIPRFKIFKYRRALYITKKSPSLVVRPMLLSHIEDLINSKGMYNYTYQIYQTLIEKWVQRESLKPGIEAKYGRGKYELLLTKFSEELAVDMYSKKEIRGGYFITSEDKFGENIELNKDLIEKINLSETERRSRSLLNRDSLGRYKFSHKSIMEYFLAKRIIQDETFAKEFDFQGNDTAKLFYNEMVMNEFLSRDYERFINIINTKYTINRRIPPFVFMEKRKIIAGSLHFQLKYSKVTNRIYDQGIRFRSGIVLFDFLFKLYLYNRIFNDLPTKLQKELTNNADFLFKLEHTELMDIEKIVWNLALSYLKDRNVLTTLESIDYAGILLEKNEIRRELSKDVTILLIAMEILPDIYFKGDNKAKLFLLNQKVLLNRYKEFDNNIGYKIGHLIGIGYDLYFRRVKDEILFSGKAPFFQKIFSFYRILYLQFFKNN